MDKEFQDDDLEIVQLLVDALQVKLSRKSMKMPSPATYLSDLLRQDTTITLKEWAARFLERRIAKNYVIMVTPVGDSAAQKALAEYTVSQVSKIYRNAVSTTFEGNIVSLFGEMREESGKHGKESAFLNQAAVFLASIHKVSGVSAPYADLEQTYFRYQQAVLTSALSQENVAFYGDYAPSQLFLHVAWNTDARAFIHPVLFEINEYDHTHKTQYFKTLRMYCYSMHNIDAASKKLYIHRNSMAYRIKRISELFNVALEEEKTARYLISSFELWDMRYLEGK